jgi:hypothetical protein
MLKEIPELCEEEEVEEIDVQTKVLRIISPIETSSLGSLEVSSSESCVKEVNLKQP